ncbi:hypothetical protein BH20ACI2_BH20ACI2_10050 [soil metagenome]
MVRGHSLHSKIKQLRPCGTAGVVKTKLAVFQILLWKDLVAEYDDIILEVWGDNPHGATPARVNGYTSRLQKVLSRYEPGITFFQNVKGRGYRFTGEFERENTAETEARGSDRPPSSNRRKWVLGASALAFLGLILTFSWALSADDELENAATALRESQIFESMVLYRSPAAVGEEDLDRFWTPESHDEPNSDRRRIKESIQKMLKDGVKYGDETRCEQFEIQSLELNKEKNFATARTLEKWFITNYDSHGALIKNKTVGPYFVDYILKKVDGRWLVEKSTTARVVRPVPQLTRVEFISEPSGENPFRLKILGRDLEPNTVHLKILGPGCPTESPCKVQHSTLLENAKISKESLDNVPITLSRGTFELFAMNGDSKESNPLQLMIP